MLLVQRNTNMAKKYIVYLLFDALPMPQSAVQCKHSGVTMEPLASLNSSASKQLFPPKSSTHPYYLAGNKL